MMERSASANRILVIDDDAVVRVLLREMLTDAGHHVGEAASARQAMDQLSDRSWHLVLLDRRLPDGDGLVLINTVKERCGCPVMVLSAMNEEQDRLLGLGLGAQDYISKPFNANELRIRVRNQLAASGDLQNPRRGQPIRRGPFALCQATHRLTIAKETHRLRPSEARLMAVFLANAGRVLSRDALTRSICQRDWTHNDRSVDVLVARLRKRIEPEPKRPSWIITVHGSGYLFSDAPDGPLQ